MKSSELVEFLFIERTVLALSTCSFDESGQAIDFLYHKLFDKLSEKDKSFLKQRKDFYLWEEYEKWFQEEFEL